MSEPNFSIQSKLPLAGESIFSKMSNMASQVGAINLSQGFPDFAVDEKLIQLVNEKMREGKNQYAPAQGTMELREAISKKVNKLYNKHYNPEKEVLVTAGATQGIFTAIMSLVRAEDEVIVFTPAYDCYAPTIELAGGKTHFIQLNAPEYSIDWDEVRQRMNRKTRMIILNTPHNPTGTILTQEDIDQLRKITQDTDVIILSDEVYEHVIFDDHPHISMSSDEELAARSVIVASFGKVFHPTGWKMGYCLAPDALMNEIVKAHQYIVFSVNTPIQYALAEYLEHENRYLGLGKFYQEKRDYFIKGLQGSKFKIIPSAGTYFQLLDYSEISDFGDEDFATFLTLEHKVASIPISVFYHQKKDDKMLRFCFAKNNDTLDAACEILRTL